jgi:hypothetical protein
VAALVLLASIGSPVPLAPVVSAASAETQTLALGAEVEALLDAGADVAPSRVDLEAFQLLGVSWARGPAGGQVRARTAEGWDEWIELDFEDRATPGSNEDANPRMVSEPIWVGRADGYELDLPSGVDDVEVHLVRPGGNAPSQPVVLAASSSTQDAPPITSRSSWGARAPKATPEVAPRLKMGFVHHTVSANDYAPADVPALLRGIQAYHMDANGWDDIGYNFLVDRAGQIWEGRSGGIDRNVVGAHVAGLNTGSVGVAVIGDHRTVAPTSASVGAVAQVLGWRLGLAGIDPTASTTMTGLDGKAVSLRTISGHRDAASTECPGQQLYDELGLIRSGAADKAATVEPLPQSALLPPAAIDQACPPGAVPGSRFSDVGGNTHKAAIECLAWYGVATGGPGGRPLDQYGPGLSVSRGQMVSFIARLIDEADPGLLPAPQGDFSCPSDSRLAVPANHPHLASIQRLAAAGVVEGGVGGAPANCFGPELEVTRAQMAAFLTRATAKVGIGLGGAPDYYTDDDASVHEAAINAISAEGIAQGTSGGNFEPGGVVRRDQMGSFLARTLNLFVEKDLASPPA